MDSTNNTAKRKSIMMILYHDINVDGRSMELLQCATELGNVTFVSYIVPESKKLDIATCKVCGGKRKYIRFVIETARRLLKEKPEIVFLQNMYGAILIKIAKLANKKAKVIYDSSELYITGVKSRGTIKQRISFLIKKMEEKYISLADVVLAPTKERAYILKGYYALPKMPLIFDNMHKLTDKVNTDKCKTIFGSLLENKFVIVYGGGIAESRYTYEICDAVHSLSDEFLLIITGAAGEDDLRRFNKWKEDTKNSNVVYFGMLKKDEWRFLLQNARISISAYKFTELNLIFCASGKVYEGLFEGVPLLASLNPPFYTLCHDYGVGVSTDNFAEGIQTIYHNYDLFLSNVKEYISTLDYNKRIPILAARIRQQIE